MARMTKAAKAIEDRCKAVLRGVAKDFASFDEEVATGDDDPVSDFELNMLVSTAVREASPKTVERAIRELAKLRGVLKG